MSNAHCAPTLRSCALGAAVLLSALTAIAFPHTAQAQDGQRVIIMTPPESPGGMPKVVGGEAQDPKRWPATLKYYLDGRLSCTATIVGPRAVITAAHCIDDQARMEVRLPGEAQPFLLTCEVHPWYQYVGLIADAALCLSNRAFPTSFAYENLDTQITRVRRGTKLFLLGYGCRKFEDIGNPQKIGQLYGGVSEVILLPSRSEDHYRTFGGVVICPGDSGGSAYILSSPTAPEGLRSIVGINSGFAQASRQSAITPLTGSVAQFITDWSKDRKTQICGVHESAANCRDRFSP